MANIKKCDCCGATERVWTTITLTHPGFVPDPAKPLPTKDVCDACTRDCNAAMRIIGLGRAKHPELGALFAIMLRAADAYIEEKTPKTSSEEEVFVPGGIFEGGIAGRVTVAEVDGATEEPKETNGHTPFLSAAPSLEELL